MIIERIRSRFKDFVASTLNGINQELFFERESESVGTMRAAEVLEDDEHPGYDLVILDFPVPWTEDYSPFINHVPAGLVKKNQIVEIFVRYSVEPMEPEYCLVSLRPFDRTRYGKSFGLDELKLKDMFAFNTKSSDNSPRFFDKFV